MTQILQDLLSDGQLKDLECSLRGQKRNVSCVVHKRKLQERYHELFSMATETRNRNNRYELQLPRFNLNIR